MPKLLIPLYAIDVQPFTATLTPTATTTFDIGKAMSTDSREYALFNNDGGEIVTHYTALSTVDSTLAATYGSDAKLGFYFRISDGAYIFEAGPLRNYMQVFESSDGVTLDLLNTQSAYGDASAEGDYVFIESANPKILYTGDGEFVIYSSQALTTLLNYHHVVFDCDLGATFRDVDYRLHHFIDGLLVNLPNLQEERSWSEGYAGGFTNRTPTGKLNHYGFKNKHVRRGRRDFTAMFNEINETDRDKLLACFRAGKGFIPMLFMGDETNTGTWMVCKMTSFTEREPNGAGVFFVECALEEY